MDRYVEVDGRPVSDDIVKRIVLNEGTLTFRPRYSAVDMVFTAVTIDRQRHHEVLMTGILNDQPVEIRVWKPDKGCLTCGG